MTLLAEAIKSCAARDTWRVEPLDLLLGVLAAARPELQALLTQRLGHAPDELRELLLAKEGTPEDEPEARAGGGGDPESA